MKKFNTSPLSGMQELLPTEQVVFDKLKQQISDVYHHYGFQSIETPLIDRTEILFAKAGGDTEKQIYRVMKTAETADSADQALRFDHTVPLARYVVEHNNDLAFPFSVTQINRNFRGERAQRGRFREFYQCDADIIGRDSLPIAYDAQVISCIYEALKAFKLPNMQVRISNRKVLSGFLSALELETKNAEIAEIIDHIEKVPLDVTREKLTKLDVDSDKVEKIIKFTDIKGDYETVEKALTELLGDTSAIAEGLSELKTVFDLLNAQESLDDVIIDLMIIRGLDYYTGTVFETFITDHRELGSISSGGRYDNLASNFSNQSFPGVGGSIGLTRLFFVLKECGLIDINEEKNPVDYCLLPLSENEYKFTMATAAKLREQGNTVDIDFETRKLGSRMNRAAKIAEYAIVIGDSEAVSGKLEAKNLKTGEKIEINL
ncbi:MAG: histidine--tRNA ligase [Candidatus Saccharibacteria bacterium]|nr:histidine--tRNA ligase [Candidatus Saccharibacteria bacterium]